jgi:hypothetical protein
MMLRGRTTIKHDGVFFSSAFMVSEFRLRAWIGAIFVSMVAGMRRSGRAIRLRRFGPKRIFT